jgi:hypothetical protein
LTETRDTLRGKRRDVAIIQRRNGAVPGQLLGVPFSLGVPLSLGVSFSPRCTFLSCSRKPTNPCIWRHFFGQLFIEKHGLVHGTRSREAVKTMQPPIWASSVIDNVHPATCCEDLMRRQLVSRHSARVPLPGRRRKLVIQGHHCLSYAPPNHCQSVSFSGAFGDRLQGLGRDSTCFIVVLMLRLATLPSGGVPSSSWYSTLT